MTTTPPKLSISQLDRLDADEGALTMEEFWRLRGPSTIAPVAVAASPPAPPRRYGLTAAQRKRRQRAAGKAQP